MSTDRHQPSGRPRPLSVRVGASLCSVLFLAAGGFGGFELHPTTHHGLHSADLVAMSLGVSPGPEEGLASAHITGAPDHSSAHGEGTPGHASRHAAGAPDHTSHHVAAAHGESADPGAAALASGADSGHTHHESGERCTCVGACSGAAVPQLSRAPAQLARAPISAIREIGTPATVVRPTPNAYLPPLPNGPPLIA